jgi:hypothetical protein
MQKYWGAHTLKKYVRCNIGFQFQKKPPKIGENRDLNIDPLV